MRSCCIVKLVEAGYRVRTTLRSLKRGADVRAMLEVGWCRPGEALSFAAADLTSDAGWPKAVDVAYREHDPRGLRVRPPPDEDGSPPRSRAPFSADEAKTYRWERRVGGTEWAAFAKTISDHQRLPAERRALLLQAIRETIDRFGETTLVRGVTYAHFARR
jgi:hypothetical protein